MYRVSAAHKTLPLPTWVEVTNLENGRKLVVRVNDRGPFKEGRIIDLSYAAAVKLGVLERGTAAVEVRALPMADAPATVAARPISVPVEVQAGAFSRRARAESIARRLGDAGLSGVRIQSTRVGRDRVWRVRLGPYWEPAHAEATVRRILALGMDPPVFVYP
jgi:rare lipoprotein A